MEIYDAPKLSTYTTAIGAYNSKSFTYGINQQTHTRARARARVRAHTHTYARTNTHTV